MDNFAISLLRRVLAPSVASCSSFTMDQYLKEQQQEWRVSSCALSTTWTALPLLSKTPHTRNSALLEFGLPKGYITLSLPTCGVVMVRVPKADSGGEGNRDDKHPAAHDELLA